MLDRFRLRYRLVIRADGTVSADIGRPPPAFVRAVADIAALHAITRGSIECKGQGSRARLHFTHGFPQAGRQAVRNVWQPPAGPGPGGGRRAAG